MRKLKIKKSKLFLGISVALLSLEIYFGGIFGYFAAKFLSGKLNSVTFNIGNYKLHFHHWMMGLTALSLTLLYSITPLTNQLFFGFMGGLIVEGISNYPDWHRIFFKIK